MLYTTNTTEFILTIENVFEEDIYHWRSQKMQCSLHFCNRYFKMKMFLFIDIGVICTKISKKKKVVFGGIASVCL